MKRKHIETLSRRELQKLAKERGIKANVKSKVLIENLVMWFERNKESKVDEEETSLDRALVSFQWETVRRILLREAEKRVEDDTSKLYVRDKVQEWGVLDLAIGLEKDDVVKFLVQNGADLNAVNEKTGLAPLHTLIEKGNRDPDLVKLMIRNGANINGLTSWYGQDKNWHFAPIAYVLSLFLFFTPRRYT